ncbi:hypothetical protein F3Y22_tig00112383pilonHSYRG00527 [Hibiscus syriacus]|uniref:RNase H type-1 domain-containing protein n=1 Tax=Hibiscus syriacus TaxID=106335 RepID=A0A6A2WZR0_HIBSY|nr:hypothetical protein F3Y22_tig00112383pilonHSYRG00527 [Hibiscus syriacus]
MFSSCYIFGGHCGCDSEQQWNLVNRFLQHCGCDSELWGVLDGLEIAWSLGANRICVETDNSEVARCLASPPPLHEPSIVRRIRSYLNRQWTVTVNSIPRTANNLADSLVNLGRKQPVGRTILAHPPAGTQRLLDSNITGLRRSSPY